MRLKVVKFKSVKSTNNAAIKLIKTKKIFLGIVVSEKQTKGKGTMGKKWVSLKGNLFASIFFRINLKKIKINNFLNINTNLIRNILRVYSKKKISIKSPNDLLIKGKKICGILQEVIEHEKKKYLIVGIGINTKKKPQDRQFESTSLIEHSYKTINNNMILKKIKTNYEKMILEINNQNFKYIKKRYI